MWHQIYKRLKKEVSNSDCGIRGYNAMYVWKGELKNPINARNIDRDRYRDTDIFGGIGVWTQDFILASS
jgi:hypothetical protein